MELENRCPFCGSGEFYFAEDDNGDVRFPCCAKCHATGPTYEPPDERDPEADAIDLRALWVFCHPAYLCRENADILGDLLADYETLYEIYTEETGCEPGRDPELMDRVEAALAVQEV